MIESLINYLADPATAKSTSNIDHLLRRFYAYKSMSDIGDVVLERVMPLDDRKELELEKLRLEIMREKAMLGLDPSVSDKDLRSAAERREALEGMTAARLAETLRRSKLPDIVRNKGPFAGPPGGGGGRFMPELIGSPTNATSPSIVDRILSTTSKEFAPHGRTASNFLGSLRRAVAGR